MTLTALLPDLALVPARARGRRDADGASSPPTSGTDVSLVSLFADWGDPASQSIAWIENDRGLSCTIRESDTAATHLVALDLGDIDSDGRVHLVTGGMYSHEPFDRMGRVTWWRRLWAER